MECTIIGQERRGIFSPRRDSRINTRRSKRGEGGRREEGRKREKGKKRKEDRGGGAPEVAVTASSSSKRSPRRVIGR